MYLLTVKDGFETRYVGPYLTTKMVSDDLKRVLASCSDSARWKIHALERPDKMTFQERMKSRKKSFNIKAS